MPLCRVRGRGGTHDGVRGDVAVGPHVEMVASQLPVYRDDLAR